jgi:N-methylhydantoinase A
LPPTPSKSPNRLSVDIGGTFTDIVLETASQLWTLKVLTSAQAPEQAVLAGAEALLGKAGLLPGDLAVFLHGTTLATNAIIERKGAPTALIATQGFRDILAIADESRYNQFDLFLERPRPLVERHLRFTVSERVDARGVIVAPLDEAGVREIAAQIRTAGVESLAVCLLHAYAAPAHELQVRAIIEKACPGIYISVSSEVSPEIREYERTSTVVANAYVQPLMAGYLGRLESELARRGFLCPLYLMTSGGGLTTFATAKRFPIRLVESGPAGGAILASRLAMENNLDRALSFDMGGTTAKICLIDHFAPQSSRTFEVDRRDRFMKGSGFPLRIPVIEMVEIGAGGGSMARIDALGRIAVGPQSAGSEPGPVCYGRGGTIPTVTDADLTLGRLDPDRFAAGTIRLDAPASKAAIHATIGKPLGLDEALAAFGIVEIVDEAMANAARVHAVERGKVVSDYTLIAFGGAAPLHVARLADKLGISRILVPPNAGVGSAVGFLRAPIAFEVVRSRYMRLDDLNLDLANQLLADMRAEARAVVEQGAFGERLMETRQVFMRYIGQGHEIVVALPHPTLTVEDRDRLRGLFEAAYGALFSRIIPNAAIEILTWTLNLSTTTPIAQHGNDNEPRRFSATPSGYRDVEDARRGTRLTIAVFERTGLAPGAQLLGPAIIVEDETATLVGEKFQARILLNGSILLERANAEMVDEK